MSRIGVTGHMNLSASTVPLVTGAILDALAAHLAGGLTGISCIAAGADTIFAMSVLDLGGALEVVLPAKDYRDRKVKPENLAQFDELVSRATHVHVLPFTEANRDAYEAANEKLLSSCDALLAVWDGQSPADKGGTAAVVEIARSRDLPVEIIWPDGAART